MFYYSSENTFEVTSLDRDCSDVGGQTIQNEASCKEAAKELGEKYMFSVNEKDSPKGCISNTANLVFWNKLETGAKSKSRKAICTGRYPLV